MSIKQYYICIFTVLLFPLSCARLEENLEEAVPSADYFEAVIAAPTEDTKTLLQEDAQVASFRSVYWQAGDVVLVGGANYTVTGGAGSPKARLSGGGAQLQDGKYKAYYPAGMVVDPVTGELEMPAVLTHPSPVDGKVVASNLPMYAESDGKDNKLSFRHLFGVFSFQITGTEKVRRIELTSTTQNLSGPFRITKLNTNYTKNLDIIEMTGTSEENKKIVLDFGPSGVQLSADELTEFLIPVPPSYSYRDDSNYYRTGGGIGSITIKIYGDSPQPIREIENPSVGNPPSAGKIVTLYKNKFLQVKLGGTIVTSPQKVSSYSTKKEVTSNYSFPNYRKRTLDFTVTTNMGYTVEISDPDAAILETNISSDVTLSPTESTAKITILENMFYPTSYYTPKPFTINDAGDRVYFAPGNLMYKPSSNQWKLADRQFDYLGTSETSQDGTVYEDGKTYYSVKFPTSTEDCWIDSFNWGTSGYNGWPENTYGSRRQPYEFPNPGYGSSSIALHWYGPQQVGKDLTDEFAMGDWGVANSPVITYQGNVTGFNWRTPSHDDMKYIVEKRTGLQMRYAFVRIIAGVSGKPINIKFRAIEDPECCVIFACTQAPPLIEGVLLFPDGFDQEHPELVFPLYYDFIKNWPEYEAAGCIFFPSTTEWSITSSATNMYVGPDGNYYYNDICHIGNGTYWTVTHMRNYGDWISIGFQWGYDRPYVFSWGTWYNSSATIYRPHLHYTTTESGDGYVGFRSDRNPVRLVRSAPSATGNVNPGGIDSGGQDVEDIDVNDTENYNYGW